MKRKLLTIVFALTAVVLYAQDNEFGIDAQLRTRGEHDNGAVIPLKEGQQSANYINERARLSFDFKRDNLQLKASVQHTGLWGEFDSSEPNGRATMVEAWAKMTFGEKLFVQAGRMQLAYDDERIFGAQDWGVNGCWHNAALLGYEYGHNRLHLIAAMNQEEPNNGDYYNGPVPYKNMQALWYHYKSDMIPLGVSLLALNTGYERGTENHGRTNYMQTYGTDITFRPMAWNVHGAFYYQMGKTSLRSVNAWLASGSIGFDFAPELSVSAGYDYMSGNDQNTKWSDTNHAFNALYGTSHKFFGAMDYFGNTVFWGLQDIQGMVKSKLFDKLQLQLNYHYLMTVQEVKQLGKRLGHEIDFQLSTELMKDVTLSAGYSTMLGTEAMDYVKNVSGSHDVWQDWAWIQLNINPRILFVKW
ncbi:MAG: alginate export family protein [Prevotella sp.]|nr:alginate export family protein [Prevotella sp.]